MKNKTVLFLTSLLAVATLSACGEKVTPSSSSLPVDDGVPTSMILPEPSGEPEQSEVAPTYPEAILLNHRIAAFGVDETFQLEPISQFKYDGKNLKYESKDTAIAIVNENGLITGVTAGETEIEVSDKNNPDLKTTVQVIVAPEITTDEAGTICDKFKAYELEHPVDEVVQLMMREKMLYKRPKAQGDEEPAEYQMISYDRSDEMMVFSVKDAYLRLLETDAEIKTLDGGIDFTFYDWLFHTNRYFDTLVYHQTGDVKTFYSAPTQDYMDGERSKPLYDLLDNLFTVGHTYFTDKLDNLKLSEFSDIVTADYSNVTDKKVKSLDDESMIFSCVLHFDSATADQDEERNYGIPYGTPTPQVQDSTWIVKENRLIGCYFVIDETYEIDNEEYLAKYYIDYKYDEISEDRSEIYVPDRNEYKRVDRLFEI